MTLIAAAVVFALGCTAAWLTARVLDRREATLPPRRLPGRRYVALSGFPQPDATPPLVQREPGQAKAAIDDGPDLWSAVYPPGSLGDHPETAPQPGPLSAGDGDVEDFLTGAIRHLRAHAPR